MSVFNYVLIGVCYHFLYNIHKLKNDISYVIILKNVRNTNQFSKFDLKIEVLGLSFESSYFQNGHGLRHTRLFPVSFLDTSNYYQINYIMKRNTSQ